MSYLLYYKTRIQIENVLWSQGFVLFKGQSGKPATSNDQTRDAGTASSTGSAVVGDKYIFSEGKLTVQVYKLSLTDTRAIDAIANSANSQLMHGGGVAYYISKEAGNTTDEECKRYVTKHGGVKVTKNYVSGPGDLKKKGVKGIIHAVGPQWWDYKDKYDQCARDLHETIVNVLAAARDKKWTSVALPAISSGKCKFCVSMT